jgi:hypothetical protein
METTIKNLKVTTAVNATIDIDTTHRAVVSANAVNPETGDILEGNIQLQKVIDNDGVESTEYAGNFNIRQDGGSSTDNPGSSGLTGLAFAQIVDVVIAAVKEEIAPTA